MILAPADINYFQFFNFHIHYYSICIFLGILAAFFSAILICKKYFKNANENVILDLTPGLVIFAIIGARIYYVILCLDYYLQNPMSIFMIWQGGIAIHGAIAGGIIYGLYYLKKRNLSFFLYADIVCTVFPLGQAIGRWGNFFNSEAYGVPVSTGAPIALYVKPALRPLEYIQNEYFFPAFLYESIFDFLIFLVLLFLIKKSVYKKQGLIFFTYIILYSILRIIIEFYRLDTVLYICQVPFPVFVSFLLIIGAIIGIYFIISRN